MIVNFEQDPGAPFGTGNFRDDSGKIMYLYDPDTAAQFVQTMPGSGGKLGKQVADESEFIAQKRMGDPGTTLRDEVSMQSDAIAAQRFGGQAPSRGPDLRLASNASAPLADNPLAMPDRGLSGPLSGVTVGGNVPTPTASLSDVSAVGNVPPNTPLGRIQAFTQLGSSPPTPPPAPQTDAQKVQSALAAPAAPAAAAPPARAAAPAGAPAGAPAVTPLQAVQQFVQLGQGGPRGTMETTVKQTTDGETVVEGVPRSAMAPIIQAERETQLHTNDALRAKARADDERATQGIRQEQLGVQQGARQDVTDWYQARQQQNDIRKEIDKLNAEYRQNEESYDPVRFKRQMSTGERVATVILAALNGGFGALIGQKSNVVLDLLNQEVERDIDKQKQQIAGNRVIIGNKISEYLRKGYKAEDAEKLAADNLRSGLINMAKLERELQSKAGQNTSNADALIQQMEEQREQRRSDQALQMVDKRQRTGQTATTEQSKTGGLSARDYLDLVKSQVDLEKSQLQLDNERTKTANTAQMANVLGKRVAPEEADKIQERVQQVGPGLAESAGLVAALKNVLEAAGVQKFNETNGQIEWPEDLKGVGFIDKRGGYASLLPGYDLAKSVGLAHPDSDRLKAAQDALVQYLATNITGATFTPQQLDTFKEMVGRLSAGSEAEFKENVQNLVRVVFQQRNAQMARLGPDGQAWYNYSQQQARNGVQAPPLVPRGAAGSPGPAPPLVPRVAPEAPAPAPQPAPGGPAEPPKAPASPEPLLTATSSRPGSYRRLRELKQGQRP